MPNEFDDKWLKITSMLDRQYRMIAQTRTPYLDAMDSLSKTVQNFSHINSIVRGDTFRSISDSLRSISSMNIRIRDDAFRESMTNFSLGVSDALESFRTRTQGLMPSIAAHQASMRGSTLEFGSSMMNLQTAIRTALDAIDFSNIMIEDEPEFIEEIEEERNNTKYILQEKYDSLNQFYERLIAYLTTLQRKNPLIAQILMTYIVSIINGHITDTIDNWAKEVISINAQAPEYPLPSERVTIRYSIDKAKIELSDVDPLFVDQIRIIVKSTLVVRERDTRQSNPLMTLQLGQKVRFLRSQGDWTKIEAYDPQSEEYTIGWVYTRYLSKVLK
jgi:hypothetical protein